MYLSGDVQIAKLAERAVEPPKGERLPRHWDPHVDPHHASLELGREPIRVRTHL